jgi:hypothetical protein
MEPTRLTCTLAIDGGPSRRVGPSGLLIGRQDDCDVVALDPSVSRRHALVRLTAQGAELVPLGRTPIAVNGAPQTKPRELADGDAIELPGLRMTVAIHAHRPAAAGAAAFRLERAGGGSFGVVHSPFVLGGDARDDLIVAGWPAHALALHLAQRELFLEVTDGTAYRNGEAITAGALEPLAGGDRLAYGDETFVVAHAPLGNATTAIGTPAGLPTAVHIELLPRGGRVVFAIGGGEHTVFLHDRRLDLLTALVRPPGAYRPGDYIPDDVVGAVVWPRNAGASRTDINVLIRRCRGDLVAAGLAGPRLIERSPAGGATRLALATGARVTFDG